MTGALDGTVTGWHRLHPLSPLVRTGRHLVGLGVLRRRLIFANHSGNNVNNGHNTAIIGSSLVNIGGQLNGAHSVSGVLNDQNNTGNFSTQNNNAPAVVLVF